VALDGQMSELSNNALPLSVEAYKHNDMVGAFSKIIDELSKIEERIALAYNTTKFTRDHEKPRFTLNLDQSVSTQKFILEIKPRQSQSVQSITRWMNTPPRIASATRMEELTRLRNPGAIAKLISKEAVIGVNVSNESLLYEVTNKKIAFKDNVRDAIASEEVLVVEGVNTDDVPSSIILHTLNNDDAEGSQ